MTKQEIYDKVKAHLLAQGRKATTGKMCAYRAQNGDKCAAGVLISDEHYSRYLEGGVVDRFSTKSKAVCNALVKSGVAVDDLPFVNCLQEIHDHAEPRVWKEELEAVARREGLNT